MTRKMLIAPRIIAAGTQARRKEDAMYTGKPLNVSRLFRRGFKLSFRAGRAKTARLEGREVLNPGPDTAALLRDGAAHVTAAGLEQVLRHGHTLALFGLVDATLLDRAIQNAVTMDV